jgi:hypothetical protein
MPVGLLFWFLMILWLLFGLGWAWTPRDRFGIGGGFLLWIVIALLGWKVFGFILQ